MARLDAIPFGQGVVGSTFVGRTDAMPDQVSCSLPIGFMYSCRRSIACWSLTVGRFYTSQLSLGEHAMRITAGVTATATATATATTTTTTAAASTATTPVDPFVTLISSMFANALEP
ncbi:hypothetical protein HZH66_007807 [Vespula vulgaris]|uniref:Uncharacterized protein n=1 Tax=Vespula vulgaris TaxID=7454 RepID=A0A834JTP9_VESVU|nr:hypothetical protein HZH66_007807 [Vespula vulgaris]